MHLTTAFGLLGRSGEKCAARVVDVAPDIAATHAPVNVVERHGSADAAETTCFSKELARLSRNLVAPRE